MMEMPLRAYEEASSDFGLTDRGGHDLQSSILLSSIWEICIGRSAQKVVAGTFNRDQDFAFVTWGMTIRLSFTQ